ncbi:MAG TPA: tRNA epoxyqueuosine(34) reductase QueG, partial [Steroidobacteraceae bacterium]|nr:tRNA epoxyqueuosine(34) reductase QueG [Steroidobacteraceae bacterium]
MEPPISREELQQLARAAGFSRVGVTGVDLAADEARLQQWLAGGHHGQMHYMERHGTRRSRPAELIPGTTRVISLAMDYWPADAAPAAQVLADPRQGYVSRYALGRDYHKVMRHALARLAADIAARAPHSYRVFVDSGPVLEKPLARNAGLGWIGKHTNLIASDAGSYFFLGEILTDLPLPVDEPASTHCGSCSACMPACPTQAIVAPFELDARRCISYLT